MALTLPEALANLGSTTLTSNYTSGGTSIAVASTSGMPASNIFHVLVADATTKLVKAVFKVTAITSLTLTTTAEVDANCSSGDLVLFTGLSVGAVKQLLADHITEGAFASAYAAGGYGRLWLPTDGPIIQHDNGASLSHFGPICAPFTDPTGVSFTQFNFGGNTTQSNAQGRVILDETPCATTIDAIRGCEIAYSIGSGNISITAAFILDFFGANFLSAGLYFRDHTGGKIVVHSVGLGTAASGGFLNGVSKYSGPGTFIANYFAGGFQPSFASGFLCNIVWLRVRDDGTNFYFSYSCDGGFKWREIFQKGRTDYIAAPDRIGFYLNPNNQQSGTLGSSVIGCAVQLLSWVQGT